MPSFDPDFAFALAGAAPRVARFVAQTERMARPSAEDPLDPLHGLGPLDLLVVEGPEHLQPARARAARVGGRAPFRVVAYLRLLPPDAGADAELIVPVFSHN